MSSNSLGISIRLSVMMFLQFFIWGGWFVTLGSYLGNNLQATDAQSSMAFSTQSWGAIIAPFIIGLIADRFFNAERILGVLHLIGAVLMYMMYQATDFANFYPYVLAYMILFMPTLALVNSVSFRQLTDPSKQFSKIRVFGTIGWVIAGIVISALAWDSQQGAQEGMLKYTFLMVAICSAVLGIYSFTLPKTPPQVDKGEKVTISDILGLDALKLLANKNFAVFFFSSVLICIPLAFYYQITNPFLLEIGMSNATGKQAIGQVSEVVFMLLLPVFLTRYGIKKTLLFGMLAWAIRYVLFAYGNADSGTWMLLIGIALHGICYDFFFVSGQIYTDSKAGAKIQSAAQGLITLATYGVGMLIGFWAAGQISGMYTNADGTHTWENIWLIPAGFSVLVFILFSVFFKNEKVAYKQD
ncbi:nucleoside transporter [Roseivirga pacifica]|uniref:Nucleoside transporter n=1 Tax=Roseivirga pacifica TaxID=1267423 RepID=A0A1I0NV67_9BACT|nr:nucleoside permease [Roseivirga pacifica]MCO6360021.1 MFS transporter [Roseivirga pacifica]MCO6367391.1 MFS transporter [Roseivirga pacifica]MCO6370078.1 MFS transporter [Roseivirga pacifica]MCO6375048.1 MFS transporter [Roseivirga pacifica]MCO6380306.1 MFS transporter [Roseivirga pacifica]